MRQKHHMCLVECMLLCFLLLSKSVPDQLWDWHIQAASHLLPITSPCQHLGWLPHTHLHTYTYTYPHPHLQTAQWYQSACSPVSCASCPYLPLELFDAHMGTAAAHKKYSHRVETIVQRKKKACCTLLNSTWERCMNFLRSVSELSLRLFEYWQAKQPQTTPQATEQLIRLLHSSVNCFNCSQLQTMVTLRNRWH